MEQELRNKVKEAAIPYNDIHGSWINFYKYVYAQYFNIEKYQYFYELFHSISIKREWQLISFYPVHIVRTILQWTFSITNSQNKKYKIITVLGFKFMKERF